ncbi:Por secretion system C-terminal sorting domain-containing protein [Flavobacteriaceae bacterium MAR_2010_188]|nr:Por secretion system C-terminal sorting domain-containing protein [Flavobacteriaceae bacterium MAR_2010_188]
MQTTTFYPFKTLILSIGLLLACMIGYSQCPNIVWQDEFTGTSLDLSKWNYQIGDGCAEGICGWGNNELQSYQQNNVVVSNGTLKITAKKERVRGSQYTSGRINTKAKADFTYGRFEASVKLPAGDGLWPAFWMLSSNEPYGPWPQSGEIDIMEFVASNPDRTLGYIHYGDPYPNNQSQGNSFVLKNDVFTNAFHEFAIEWEPGIIRWYVDGILFSTKTTQDVAPYNWPFDQDFHFLLNVAVGGNLGGPVNNNMLPATMEVDYVRVYDGFKAYIGGDDVVANQEQGVSYSIGNVTNNTNVSWSVPSGATIVSGQGTPNISVNFGNESGTVSASFNDGCSTVTLDLAVEVEPSYVKSYAFENFDAAATATYASSTGTLTELANPSPNATNSSALSGKYDRNAQEQYDILVYNVNTITDGSLYVNKTNKFYVDIYTTAPIGTQITLQLETSNATASNYPTGRHSRYSATITENGNWHRLQFTLLDRPDITASDTGITTMILLFASNSYTSDTYYFDNLDSYTVDTGTPTNQSPNVSISNPSNGSSYSTGTNISIAANATDGDGSISQVEFFVNGSSIGVDTTSPYSRSWSVASGTSDLTAVATDNLGASTTSSVVSVTGTTTGTASSMYVSSIVTGTASAAKGSKYGTASVTILNNLGNPVSNATVTGTFSGTFSEQRSALTNSNGVASFITSASAKGTLVVNFCVGNVAHASLTYNSANNTITCVNSTARLANRSVFTNFKIYPNPVEKSLNINMEGSSGNFSYVVYDFSGKILLSGNIQDKRAQLNVSTLASGLYLISLKDNDNIEKIMKFVKD